MGDILADLITRLRNGQMANRLEVSVLKTNYSVLFLDLLKKEGFIRGYKFNEKTPNEILVLLKYHKGKAVIKKINKVSTSGRRIYIKVDVLWRLNHGFGCLILSTTKGLITDETARELRLGGEVIAYLE
jgi:small subunit ribosomal protein S8